MSSPMHDVTNDLTPDQQKALKEFREQLAKDGLIDDNDSLRSKYDFVLLRFLRARKFDVKQSTAMFANCVDWRNTVAEVGVDQLYKNLDPYDYPGRQDVFKYWPLFFHKTDKLGRPINVQTFGQIDINGLNKVIAPEKHWEAIVVNGESLPREVLPACSHVAGKLIDTVLVIVDLKGFSVSKFWQIKHLVRNCFQMSQDCFPETMGHLAVINAPYSFSVIWNAIRPWLAKETQDKVETLGSDYATQLKKLVDPENLPTTLGGECHCEESGGCHLSSAGPWMDGRKERREKWVKGEVASTALPYPWEVMGEGEKVPVMEETKPQAVEVVATNGNAVMPEEASVETDKKAA